MKRIVIIFIVILLLLSCENQDKVKIGIVGTMTGPQSSLSIAGRRGVELAVAEINSNGGLLNKQVELVVKDNKNDEQRTIDIVKEFDQEHVEVVIGPFVSNNLLLSYDEIHQYDILFLSPTVTTNVFSKMDDQVIRFIAQLDNQVNELLKVAEVNKHKKFMIIADKTNKGFYNELVDKFKSELIANKGEIISVVDYSDLNDHKLIEITDLAKDNNIQGIFIISNAADFATIGQTIRTVNEDVTYYGSLWSHTNEVMRLGGLSIEGSYIISGISNKAKNDRFNKVAEDYFNRYGESISFAAMYSYETMMALADAIEKGKSLNDVDVKAELLSMQVINGLQEEFELDIYGDSNRKYVVDKIINGGFETID